MFSIRRYNSEDNAAVWELHVAVLKASNAYIASGVWDEDLNHIEDVYLKDGEFLVGTVDGKIVSMGALKRISSAVGEIKRMRTDPKFWRQGFAQAILNRLEERARELGYQKLVLDTQTVAQKAAQRLYEKNGYHEARRGTLGGLEVIYYEKKLGPGVADI
jgi:GNAT superfamily N-acetyltransferase